MYIILVGKVEAQLKKKGEKKIHKTIKYGLRGRKTILKSILQPKNTKVAIHSKLVKTLFLRKQETKNPVEVRDGFAGSFT